MRRRGRRARFPLFLGDLSVVPRSALLRLLEFDGAGGEKDMALRRWIAEALELPALHQKRDSISDYLVIDVMLGHYRTGGSFGVTAGGHGLLLFWRPCVKLHFRLRDGGSDDVLGRFRVTKKMRWGEYIRKAFSWRGLFGLGGLSSDDEMRTLLLAGLLEGMKWARRRASA